MNNWIEISEEHLLSNLAVLQAAAGPRTEVLAVVKANGYGHGAERCAGMLARGGARWLGVTCASEGVRVRAAAGPDVRLLIMCGTLPEDAPLLEPHGLTPVVWTSAQVRSLAAHPGLRVHVEVDTGMGRQGVLPGEPLEALLGELRDAGLEIEGLFTHFCSSEVADSALTLAQGRRFQAAVQQVHDKGVRVSYVHAGNSSAVDNPQRPRGLLAELAGRLGARAMVRSGLALYGYTLPIEGDAAAQIRPSLQPVLTWKAHVLAVRALAAGETVGYNATFTADQPMRVALLPVGYADGLRRELSGGRGAVMLHGRRAPIVGRISMNLTVVDVSGIPAVDAGDQATLLGPGITAEDHAALAGTIPYEILCGIHPCG